MRVVGVLGWEILGGGGDLKGGVNGVIKKCMEPMQLGHAANAQIMYSQFISCSKLAAMQGI